MISNKQKHFLSLIKCAFIRKWRKKIPFYISSIKVIKKTPSEFGSEFQNWRPKVTFRLVSHQLSVQHTSFTFNHHFYSLKNIVRIRRELALEIGEIVEQQLLGQRFHWYWNGVSMQSHLYLVVAAMFIFCHLYSNMKRLYFNWQ